MNNSLSSSPKLSDKLFKYAVYFLAFNVVFIAIAAIIERFTISIIVESPHNRKIVDGDSVLIKGTVEPAEAELFLNESQRVPLTNGSFSVKVSMQDTANTYTFKAVSSGRRSEDYSLTVIRGLSGVELAEKERAKQEELNRIAEEEERELRKWERTKAGKIQKKHPEWTREDCEKVAKGYYWIGMHVDMLKYQRGLPNSANPSDYGNGRSWQWCWSDWTPSCFYDSNDDGYIDSYN